MSERELCLSFPFLALLPFKYGRQRIFLTLTLFSTPFSSLRHIKRLTKCIVDPRERPPATTQCCSSPSSAYNPIRLLIARRCMHIRFRVSGMAPWGGTGVYHYFLPFLFEISQKWCENRTDKSPNSATEVLQNKPSTFARYI